MSYVTSIVLIFTGPEDFREEGPVTLYPVLDETNVWLEERYRAALADIGEHAGGNKHMQINVWGGAFNGLNVEEFLEVVAATAWEYPEQVTVIVNQEQQEGITILAVPELRKTASCPPP